MTKPNLYISSLWACLIIFVIVGVSNTSFAQTKTYKVGVYQNQPKIFLNDNNVPKGFFVELTNALAEKIGFEVEYVEVTWPQSLEMLEKGQIDIMPDVIYTKRRDDDFVMNNITILENWASLYIHQNEEPSYYTFQNMKGMTVAVLEEDDNLSAFKSRMKADSTSINFLIKDTYLEVLKAVEKKEADMGLVNFYYGKAMQSEIPVQELSVVINPATIHYAGREGATEAILADVDRQLVLMKENHESIYYELIDKWLKPYAAYRFPRWVSMLLAGLVGILFVSVVMLASTYSRLRQHERELQNANTRLKEKVVEKEQVEQSLTLRNNELATTNHTIDQLIYQVSHNLRAPVASCLGLVQLLKMEDLNSLSFADSFQKMDKSLNGLDTIINNILHYHQNKRTDLMPETIELSEMVDSLFESMAYMNPKQKPTLETAFSLNAPLVTDRYRLGMILHNLICNAIRYQNPYTEEKLVLVEGECTSKQLTLRVTDNGLGIREEVQPSIFKMFFRATTVGKGAGLGLFLVKQVVEKLEGSIEFVSEPSKGTTFTIKIPNLANRFTESFGEASSNES